MWTEVVKFQPKIDPAAAAGMENNLNKRFNRVSNKLSKNITGRFGGRLGADVGEAFGGGFATALLGSFAAAAVILGKHMIDAVGTAETKMKGLIAEAQTTTELADKLNTSTGELERFRALGSSVGVKPSDTDALLVKFQSAILDAKKDLFENHGNPTSQQSNILKNFVDRKDIPQAFLDFMRGLRAQGADGPLSPSDQAARNLFPKGTTSKDIQQASERLIFGDVLPSKLVNTDLDAQLGKVGGPSAATLTNATNKVARIGGQVDLSNATFGLNDFAAGSNKMNSMSAMLMTAREQQTAREATNKLDVYTNISDITKGVMGIKETFDKVLDNVTSDIGSPLKTLQRWFTSGGKSTGATVENSSGNAPAGARKGDF